MPYNQNNLNNNNRQPTVNTYTPMNFANPDSALSQTKFNVSYFNRMMCISIAQRNQGNGDSYPTYNNDTAITVYISATQAKILHDMAVDMFSNPSSGKNNVCIEAKDRLLKISNGTEFGVGEPCITISYVTSDGASNEIIYHCKNSYAGAYNYSDGQFNKQAFPMMEIDTFLMALEQYYLASSYAIAATVREASMYRDRATYDIIRSIADKMGITSNSNAGSRASYSSKSFLSGGSNTTPAEDIPKQYSSQTFDDLVNSMTIGVDDD